MKSYIEQLPNGLTVVMRESHGAPVVAFQVWVGVGGADERENEAGLAHVLEHMLFKGTERRGVGEIARDVERAGGYINAWTSHDETVYHVTMASRFAAKGLDVLADAVMNAALDRDELSRELHVILEEIRMGEDNPARASTELLFKHLFNGHPYSRPVIGHEKSVRGFNKRTVKGFYKRWYIPANTVLVIVGDFKTGSMRKMVERAFGDWEGNRNPRRAPRQAQMKRLRFKVASKVLPISEAHLALGFRIPGFEHEDVPALDLLAAILGQGASGRLEMEVRRSRGLGSDIRALSYTPREVGLFGVFAMANPKEISALVTAAGEQIHRLTETPASPREVEKARSMLMSESVYSEETVDGMARKLGYYGLHSGDPDFERRYVAGLATAQPDRLLEVARKYLKPSAAVICAALPDPAHRKYDGSVPWVVGGKKSPCVNEKKLEAEIKKAFLSGFEKKKGTARVGRKDPVVHELDGGDVVIIKPDATARTVAVRAAFLGGLRAERPSKGGLSMLMANSLTRGTVERSAQRIALEMDSLACSISGFTGRNTFGVHGEFLSRNFAEGFEIMSQSLRSPAFGDEEVNREAELLMDEIRASADNLDFQAFRLFHQSMFGKHPYGRSVLGTKETVSGIRPSDLRKQLGVITGEGRMVAAVVGGVDPDEALEMVSENLLATGGPTKGGKTPGAWLPPKGPKVSARSMPKEQSHLVLGFPGISIGDPDRFAVDIITEILGGHGGRLFSGVRETKGLAYSVTATSMEGVDPGYVAMYAGTAPGQERTVVEAMIQELSLLLEEGASSSELARVKNHLVGTRAISAQRAGSRAASTALGYLYGLGPEMDTQYPEGIGKVTAGQVLEVAGKIFDFNKMVVSCVGPDAESTDLL